MSAGLTTYHPANLLTLVKGVGPANAATLAEKGLKTVQDLLLCLPLRYEDRSKIVKINALLLDEPITIIATVKKFSQFFRSGRTMSTATIADDSGTLTCFWFNNPYLRAKLIPGTQHCFAGKVSLNPKTHQPVLTQAVVENLSAETIHTGRIVPLYSQTLILKQGSVRRILKEILDHLAPWKNFQILPASLDSKILNLTTEIDLAKIFATLHFPDSAEAVILARERLALEELLSVIDQATKLKTFWSSLTAPASLKLNLASKNLIPATIPFNLTPDQNQAILEILANLNQTQPMNRLLMGDVGSGKTVVAGIAAYWLIKAGHNAALIAPTQILAEQHFQTIQKILPALPVTLVTGATSAQLKITAKAQLFIGTHAILNQLEKLQPALIIYDEQHRFGVKHRSPGWTGPAADNPAADNQAADNPAAGGPATDLPAAGDDVFFDKTAKTQPHLLTMSATPIPRSLMLSLFAHLTVSTLSQPPQTKLPTETWLVPKSKKLAALAWIKTQLTSGLEIEQGLYVCPFINPSETAGFENIAAATATFTEIKNFYNSDPNFQVALLHGGLKPKTKASVIADLFSKKIQLLVTTPIVEVGVDLPAAKLIVIDAAERFGLASLHQLRGRVGRAGQASFCLLFTQTKSGPAKERLKLFCKEHNGFKLAELDLERRGAGDLFGTSQSGFSDLQFANWTNLSLISQARELHQQISTHKISWQPIFNRQKNVGQIGQN